MQQQYNLALFVFNRFKNLPPHGWPWKKKDVLLFLGKITNYLLLAPPIKTTVPLYHCCPPSRQAFMLPFFSLPELMTLDRRWLLLLLAFSMPCLLLWLQTVETWRWASLPPSLYPIKTKCIKLSKHFAIMRGATHRGEVIAPIKC